jgi:hypothetical protein
MGSTVENGDSMPWFVKLVITIAILVALFIIGIDLLTFASSL